MRRGTTPTLLFMTDFDWTGYTLQLTIEEGDTELVFEGERLTLVDKTNVQIKLTQEETLMFTKKAQAQIKAKLNDCVVATDIGNISVQPILNERVM